MLQRKFGFQKRGKFGAIRTNGMSSKLEAAVHQILLIREKAGEISDIQQQCAVDLSCGIKWKVDFSFLNNFSGEKVWAEAKGVETERYRICLKLWRGGNGPGKIEIWKGDYRRPTCVEIITPTKRRS